MAATFLVWYASEKTLSIHSIFTVRREAFYWLVILFTFALGTAAGDLVAETFGFGYLTTAILFAGVIAVITAGHFLFGLHAIPSFWLAYIVTRPLGASIGDFLSQPVEYGGLGLGTILTSLVFLVLIVATVIHMTARSQPETKGLAVNS